MISLYVNDYSVEYMAEHNGDIVIKNPVSCVVEMKRNAIWYCTLEFPMSELTIEPQEEMVIKLDLNFKKSQLFRVIYRQENKSKHTYVLYASHIFFDVQKESYVVYHGNALMDWQNIMWDVNHVITMSSPNYNYNVVGKQGYNYYSSEPIDENTVYFVMDGYASQRNIASNAVVDVPYQSMTYCKLSMTRLNTTLAQQFVFEKYDETYWIIKNKKSGLVWDVYGAQAYNGCPIYQVAWNGGDNQLWKIDTVLLDGEYRRIFKSKLDISYCACHGSKYVEDDTYFDSEIQLYKLADQIPSRYTFITVDKRAVELFEWKEMNAIEILFGTDENSLVNRWEEVEDKHVTAMFDNLTCYFGAKIEGDNVDWVQPKTYKIKASEEKLDLVKKVTMEKVYTGIIPKGYHDRGLPTENGRYEIVKSDLWDTYRVHRIKESTYSEVVLLSDNPSADYFKDDVYETEEQFYNALRAKAKEELDRNNVRYPSKDVKIKTEFLFADEQIASNIKLNDVLYIGDEYGFYFESMKYDVISKRVTDVSLVAIEG